MEVLGSHLNFSAYGFWLPNDDRGSNSKTVRAPHLRPFGPAPASRPKFSVARKPHDWRKNRDAKDQLMYAPVEFTGRQALSIAKGFRFYIEKSGLVVPACAILPRHVHLVTLRHRIDAEHIVGQLKAAATRQLIADGLHPFQHLLKKLPEGEALPSPWGRGCTKVFLFTDDDIEFEIDYVEGNPLKEGKPKQTWSFVMKFVRGMRGCSPTESGTPSHREPEEVVHFDDPY
jgi:hypothetical protein